MWSYFQKGPIYRIRTCIYNRGTFLNRKFYKPSHISDQLLTKNINFSNESVKNQEFMTWNFFNWKCHKTSSWNEKLSFYNKLSFSLIWSPIRLQTGTGDLASNFSKNVFSYQPSIYFMVLPLFHGIDLLKQSILSRVLCLFHNTNCTH